MTRARRFSQAISEGDGISVVADVRDADGARRAEAAGADGIVVGGGIHGVRDATELPILWRADAPVAHARDAGFDGCILAVSEAAPDGALEAQHTEALELGLDCVVDVSTAEELALALDRVDPEIFLLSPRGADGDGLEHVLELLEDVPAGKLAIAEVAPVTREQLDALERAGVDGVIVAPDEVAPLVGAEPHGV